jgi:hypothetical protein
MPESAVLEREGADDFTLDVRVISDVAGCHNSTPRATRDYVDRVEGGIDLYATTA